MPPAQETFAYKLVIVVRKDLRLSPGKLAVQVAHAAVDCALKAKADDARRFQAWHREGQKKVVVLVPDLKALHEVREAAKASGLTTSLISDAGKTEVDPGTVTCVGVGPGSEAQVGSVTGHLPLL